MTKIPQNISYEEAAAAPLGALNALHFMNHANIKAGETILIIGAGGSIGLFAVQIAIAKGAHVSVVDKTSKMEMLRALKIEECIDYQQQDIYQQSKQYDIVFNMVADGSYSKNLQLVKPNGRYVMGNPKFRDMLRSIVTPRTTGKNVLFAFAKESTSELETIARMMAEKKIVTIIDEVLPMTEIASAHDRVEQEQRNGALIVLLGKES
jgi:NADPH:quinone reductase-like Zn-dependent oxidoreductase